jgi:AcrR family transcriptional regulator
MSTAKGEETRRRIVWAAWELSSARGIEQLLCGVSLREVAATADMSPSAVTYHYPTMRDLALAMVEEFVDSLSPQAVDSVASAFGGVEARPLADTVREAAAANWAVLTSPEEVVFERRLTRCYSATGSEGDGQEVARNLRRFNRLWVEELSTIYEQASATMGLHPVEPFTFEELAQIIAAMTEGLLHHWMCDPDSVRPDLISDAAVAIASVLTAPVRQPVGLAEVGARLSSGAVEHLVGGEDLVAAATDAAHLFADGVQDVTLTEVAAAMGWRPDEVMERFGSVRRVAAVSFARHLPQVEQASVRRNGAMPAVCVCDATYELVRSVERDPWCALSLHMERLEARARQRTGQLADRSRAMIDALVPVAGIFEGPIRAVRGDASIGCGEAADLLVDTVLAYGGSRPDTALNKVAELALKMTAPECLEGPLTGA